MAYVYLPDTAQGGYTSFNRYYFAQLDKDGAVVDERFNGGGQAADYIIDYLRKPLMSYWAMRDGEDYRTPFGTILGPKVMLINEYAGSGGDLMPWIFRRAGIGPLVGKRTWGGLVGIGGYPPLIDGGSVTAPHFAFYTPEGQWEVENPASRRTSRSSSTRRPGARAATRNSRRRSRCVLEELKKNPQPKTKRPAYPNYHNGRTANPGKKGLSVQENAVSIEGLKRLFAARRRGVFEFAVCHQCGRQSNSLLGQALPSCGDNLGLAESFARVRRASYE